MASLTTSTTIGLSKPFESQISQPINEPCLSNSLKPSTGQLRSKHHMCVWPVTVALDKFAESIKQAEDACSGDPVCGDCAAAWDEVEELSAAARHAREKKGSDPPETFCKDNPEIEECCT